MIANRTLNVIRQRRSIRSYRDEQITDDELRAVLQAGLYAPNAGDQAWHFTVVQNRGLLGRLNVAKQVATQMGIPGLMDLAADEGYNCIHGAPTLIIVSGDEQAPMPLDADCAAATQNMLIAAESIGLGSCWIFYVQLAFHSPQGPELRQALRIPGGYKPHYSAAFGYRKDSVPEAPDRKPNLVTIIA